MHGSVIEFVRACVDLYDLRDKDVLEIGSMDVNGSVRGLFRGGSYLGIDMRPGPGVDLVVNAHDLIALPVRGIGEWDVVVCCEVLEHDDQPWLTLSNAWQMARAGGYLIVTARGFDERGSFRHHEHPADLWRYSVKGMESLLEYTLWPSNIVLTDPEAPGVFAVARKGYPIPKGPA